MNTNFLEDESLTDNMDDTLAAKVISWLEYLASNRPELLESGLAVVKLLNKDKSSTQSSDLDSDTRVGLEMFEMQITYLKPQDMAITQTVDYILNRGEVE